MSEDQCFIDCSQMSEDDFIKLSTKLSSHGVMHILTENRTIIYTRNNAPTVDRLLKTTN